tara:strand:- start:200 stop:355 length:156 start_codon:yes stop_codon:yes gene_type:complete
MAGLRFVFHHHRNGTVEDKVKRAPQLPLFEHNALGPVILALTVTQEVLYVG